MTFSTLAPLKPISRCGQSCVAALACVQIAFCIVALAAEFWTLGFSNCTSGSSEVYVYLLLDKGLCIDTTERATAGQLEDCTAWASVGNGGAAGDDAGQYEHSHGLFASALAFAVVELLVTGAAYMNIQTEYTDKLRYTQIFFGVLVTALTAAAVGSVSETFYTDESNYPYYAFCSDSYTKPGAGWILGFFCVWVAAASVGALLFPCLRCGYSAADDAATPPDDTYNAVVRSA